MEDIKKALETIALKNSEGVVPDDLLIKACDAYKIKSDGFLDDYDYHVCVAKSLYDHLNGIEPDGDIISGIYESVRGGSKEAIGTYAALKGYDAIVEPHGNGGPNSFMIILNRSKVIVKK